MTDERVGREGWDAIWEGCFESTERLLGEGLAPPADELAAVLELPVSGEPPVESGDEPEGAS